MYSKIPMLKFLASTRTVQILWNKYNVQNSVTKYFLETDECVEKWNSIQEDLELKFKNCRIIPKELRIPLSSLVKPIGDRIKKFIENTYDYYLPNHFISMISWTILGIIDEKKTAGAVIKMKIYHLTGVSK
ncbi:hypothetical protein TNCT_9321 [Trichonephila clavata]|uniref:Uncharacterized protein n=1 Tax=Trichonephila clavata TaxID=2740835 RepID=A0A8X6FEZ6_TRICU|nr:hypothetical protein TNCT_9321 [Trichonephila clavata]